MKVVKHPRPLAPPLTWSALLAVSAGGAVGACLRALVSALDDADWLAAGELTPTGVSLGSGWPWATLLINVSGSFLLAIVAATAAIRSRRLLQLFLGPGLLGGFTTLSTYAAHGVILTLHPGSRWPGVAYLVLTVLGCVAAVSLAQRLRPGLGSGRGTGRGAEA